MTDTSRHVATIPKNRTEELRVTVDLFKGHHLLNLRVWFTSDDGTMRPANRAWPCASTSRPTSPAPSGRPPDDRRS